MRYRQIWKENHDSLLMRLSEGQRLVRMQYVSKEVSEALVSQITKGFGIDVNIIFGDIDIVADTPVEGVVPFSMMNRYGLTRL